MGTEWRKKIRELTLREYSLYRAICNEMDDLQQAILLIGITGKDFDELVSLMRDRRLLVEWLRELHMPPSADYIDTGLNLEAENQLIAEAREGNGKN